MADGTAASIAPAVIGLVGVLIGGIITAGTNYVIAVRKERVEKLEALRKLAVDVATAARMIREELLTYHFQICLAATDPEKRYEVPEPPTKIKDEYAATLAGTLPLEDWLKISDAYKKPLYLGEGDNPTMRKMMIEGTGDKIVNALGVLGSYTSHPHERSREHHV
jgi:hypothetical protein